MSEMALASPVSRGRSCVPPAPGMMPSVTSGSPTTASAAAMRASQPSAISKPPPNAAPEIAAITGFGHCSMAAMISGTCGSRSGFPNSRMSAPAMKVLLAPMRTMAVTLASSASARTAPSSPSRTSKELALTGGLSMTANAVSPARSTRTRPAASCAISFFSVAGICDIGHRYAVLDGLAARRLGLRLALRGFQHFAHEIARDEAYAAIVGDDEVARHHANVADLHRPVDLHGLDAPFARDRRDVGCPDGIAEGARMGDVAHAAHDDRAYFSLALAGLRGDAAHVGDIRHALDDEHVAGRGEIVRLELGHAVDVRAGGLERIAALEDVAYGKRGPDDGGAGKRRLEDRSSDNAGANAELIHDVGHDAGGVAERHEARDDGGGRPRHRHHPYLLGGDAAG